MASSVTERLSCAFSKALRVATALTASSTLACAVVGTQGASVRLGPVPVFLPGEQIECLFEVIGEVSVEGPFEVRDDVDGGTRGQILESVRLEVGQEGAARGAHAVMVREVLYDENPGANEANTPEITSVEGMLLSFVDPACVPNR